MMEVDEILSTRILSKNQRGVKIVLTNSSSHTFALLTASLESGDWTVRPPEEIAAGSVVNFGAVASAWMSGTEGRCSYGTSSKDKVFRVVFSNPFSFFSRAEVKIFTAAALDGSANFSCDAHTNGYYLHAHVEVMDEPSTVRHDDEEGGEEKKKNVVVRRPQKEDSAYESMVNVFIRPSRHIYDEETDLGPETFSLCDAFLCRRKDFSLRNREGVGVKVFVVRQGRSSRRCRATMCCLLSCKQRFSLSRSTDGSVVVAVWHFGGCV